MSARASRVRRFARSRALFAGYAALGFAFHDDAVAHVTIARVKDSRRPLPLVEFAPINFVVERVSLFESIFDKAATRHDTKS